MKFTTKKQHFQGVFNLIRRVRWSLYPSISRLSITVLLLFSLDLLLPSNVFSNMNYGQQVPVKKVTIVSKKSTSVKVVKGKPKKVKRKKSIVAKQDSLQDIDPTSTSSPLYKN